MNEVKRWTWHWPEPSAKETRDGGWVQAQDYDALRHEMLGRLGDAGARIKSLEADAKRYQHLRDHTGNAVMRKLMQFCTPEMWDETVDADMPQTETKGDASGN